MYRRDEQCALISRHTRGHPRGHRLHSHSLYLLRIPDTSSPDMKQYMYKDLIDAGPENRSLDSADQFCHGRVAPAL